MTRAEWLALAERIEALTEPDRHMDAEIALAVFGGEVVWRTANYTMELYPVRQYRSDCHVGGWAKEPVPEFTGSIDAALTLVPDKWTWTAGRHETGCGHAHTHNGEPHFAGAGMRANPNRRYAEVRAPTPALALSAASCRAWAEMCDD